MSLPIAFEQEEKNEKSASKKSEFSKQNKLQATV